MATITKPNTFSAGAVIVASEHNSNFDTIYNDYNGNITNVNIAAAAAIADTKLAQITTASKVNATALTETSEGAGTVLGHDGTNWSSISASTSRYRVLMSMGSTSAASFQQINLASASAITSSDPLGKAWVNFNGKSLAIQDSYNVDSVVTNGTGKYCIKWDTNFANTAHAIVATCNTQQGSPSRIVSISSIAVDAARIYITNENGAFAGESSMVCVIAMGDQ